MSNGKKCPHCEHKDRSEDEIKDLENELQKINVPEIWPDEKQSWESRRSEIVDIFQSEMFGYLPEAPEEISFENIRRGDEHAFCGGKVNFLSVRINTKVNGKDFSFPMYAAIPKGKKDLPFFIHISFKSDRALTDLPDPDSPMIATHSPRFTV